jgi:hypothetical protein
MGQVELAPGRIVERLRCHPFAIAPMKPPVVVEWLLATIRLQRFGRGSICAANEGNEEASAPAAADSYSSTRREKSMSLLAIIRLPFILERAGRLSVQPRG